MSCLNDAQIELITLRLFGVFGGVKPNPAQHKAYLTEIVRALADEVEELIVCSMAARIAARSKEDDDDDDDDQPP